MQEGQDGYFSVHQGPSNSVCCILNTKSPDCQTYQYCQGEKVSTQRTIEHWKVAGIVGAAADGLLQIPNGESIHFGINLNEGTLGTNLMK
jgi:hypothetical protein